MKHSSPAPGTRGSPQALSLATCGKQGAVSFRINFGGKTRRQTIASLDQRGGRSNQHARPDINVEEYPRVLGANFSNCLSSLCAIPFSEVLRKMLHGVTAHLLNCLDFFHSLKTRDAVLQLESSRDGFVLATGKISDMFHCPPGSELNPCIPPSLRACLSICNGITWHPPCCTRI